MTHKRLVKIAMEVVGCVTLTSPVNSYWSSSAAEVSSHTQCRLQQEADHNVTTIMDLLSAVEMNRTLLCERHSLRWRSRQLGVILVFLDNLIWSLVFLVSELFGIRSDGSP